MFGAYEVPRQESALSIILWWEFRRGLYNFGLVVLYFATDIGISVAASPHLAPGQDAIEPMAVFFFLPWYLGIANACYTAGWITELALRWFKKDYVKIRKKIFWGGIVFSCLITSVPFWMACYYTLHWSIYKR